MVPSLPKGSVRSALGGLRDPENVTAGARRRTSAGPTPRTLVRSSSSDAKEPAESRAAAIRRASAGPIPGRDSSWATEALLRSRVGGRGRGARGGAAARLPPARPGPGAAPDFPASLRSPPRPGRVLRPRVRPCRTESTARICASSAALSELLGAGTWLAETSRAAEPRTATRERKSSAFFSPGVGTPETMAGWRAGCVIIRTQQVRKSGGERRKVRPRPNALLQASSRRRRRSGGCARRSCRSCPGGCGGRSRREAARCPRQGGRS